MTFASTVIPIYKGEHFRNYEKLGNAILGALKVNGLQKLEQCCFELDLNTTTGLELIRCIFCKIRPHDELEAIFEFISSTAFDLE